MTQFASDPINEINGVDSRESSMPSFWLPPGAQGNGLQAKRWALIVTVCARNAQVLLDAFAAERIAAAVALHDALEPHGQTDVWVDSSCYAHAENVLLRETLR